ncbi:hypothetical protein PC116_g9682 [Phytophthora cactorum]|uniref:Uncharacterized protein n=1 Tax=Phytophthora cactorum TaxID=29920 RepID=A0A8T1L3V0_9STRA|nr:hypothetical protein PC112_g9622 [Phytophthora cactorum]KAG2834857.1 hypothetical protein PC111_g5671 [Phytophthora cactorum]KAG2983876.1 hypothetical protein PC118_g9184 [Phytophthora cactorum]KAG3202042.1 hypothetical protein PC128_g3488 [Phytophthora cactorum]KAG4054242.1 hypothetical protein PC123_g10646 [Phytophthora cactorum]
MLNPIENVLSVGFKASAADQRFLPAVTTTANSRKFCRHTLCFHAKISLFNGFAVYFTKLLLYVRRDSANSI